MQQFFILIFLAFSVGFHRTMHREKVLEGNTKALAIALLYTLYTFVALITVSNSLYIPAKSTAKLM